MISRDNILKKLGEIITNIQNTPAFRQAKVELERLHLAHQTLTQKKSAKTDSDRMALDSNIDAEIQATEKALQKKGGEFNALKRLFHFDALMQLEYTLQQSAMVNYTEVSQDLALIEQHLNQLGQLRPVDTNTKSLSEQVAARLAIVTGALTNESKAMAKRNDILRNISRINASIIKYINGYEKEIQKLAEQNSQSIGKGKKSIEPAIEEKTSILTQIKEDHAFILFLQAKLEQLELLDDTHESQLEDIKKALQQFNTSQNADIKKENANNIKMIVASIQSEIQHMQSRARTDKHFDTIPVPTTPMGTNLWQSANSSVQPTGQHSGKLKKTGTPMPTIPSDAASTQQFADLLPPDSIPPFDQSPPAVAIHRQQPGDTFAHLDLLGGSLIPTPLPSQAAIPASSTQHSFDPFAHSMDSHSEATTDLSQFFSDTTASHQAVSIQSADEASKTADALTSTSGISRTGTPSSSQQTASSFTTLDQVDTASHTANPTPRASTLQETKETAETLLNRQASSAAFTSPDTHLSPRSVGVTHSTTPSSTLTPAEAPLDLLETKGEAPSNSAGEPTESEKLLDAIKARLIQSQESSLVAIQQIQNANAKLLAKNKANDAQITKLEDEENAIKKSRFTSKKRREHIPGLITAAKNNSAGNVAEMKANRRTIASIQSDSQLLANIFSQLDTLQQKLVEYKEKDSSFNERNETVIYTDLQNIDAEINVFSDEHCTTEDRHKANNSIICIINGMIVDYGPVHMRRALRTEQDKAAAENAGDEEKNDIPLLTKEIELIKEFLCGPIEKSNRILTSYEYILAPKGPARAELPTQNPQEIEVLKQKYDKIMDEKKPSPDTLDARRRLQKINNDEKAASYHIALKKDKLLKSAKENLKSTLTCLNRYQDHKRMRDFASNALSIQPALSETGYHNLAVVWAAKICQEANNVADLIQQRILAKQPKIIIAEPKPLSFGQKIWRNKFTILLTLLGLAGAAAFGFFTIGLGTIPLIPFVVSVSGIGIGGSFIAGLLGSGIDALLRPPVKLNIPQIPKDDGLQIDDDEEDYTDSESDDEEDKSRAIAEAIQRQQSRKTAHSDRAQRTQVDANASQNPHAFMHHAKSTTGPVPQNKLAPEAPKNRKR
ncbi:MAG: hypothetical protein P4M14_13325 [Gammaproteobacteria bacterium]|nr:hypothetical protein [Gammaproteobacteria bacterium]